VLPSGTHNFTVTNDVGCTSLPTSDAIINVQPVSPVVNLGVDQTLCGNLITILDAGNPGSTYLWTPGGQTTQTRNVDTVGHGLGIQKISVLVTAANTCSTMDSIKITFYDCTGIEENNSSISYSIIPNPSDGIFYLTVNGLTESAILDIYNMTGSVIYTQKIENSGFENKMIDLLSYPKGIYFVRLVSNKYSHIEKIIIN
jgi:hypothetical protein